MTVLVRTDALTRVYGHGQRAVTALDGVTMSVTAGELVAVMGPSGSGKTTLLRLLGGLDIPTSGSVAIDGVDLAALTPRGLAALRRQTVGYLFQDLNLIPTLSALENVSLPLDLDNTPRSQARSAATEALDAVSAVSVADRMPPALSGGEAQRVALARSLVGPRKVLLADEPTGALDTVTGERVMRLIRERIDSGLAGVVVTHDARLAGWADRTIFLHDGAVAAEAVTDAPDTLLRGA